MLLAGCLKDFRLEKYLLVCEGPTDTFIINKLAQKIYETREQEVEIVTLAPQIDATTGKWERHGWNGVRNWCKKYGFKTEQQLARVPESLRPSILRQSWRALMAISGAKGLIIQLDSDIAEQITDLPAFDAATTVRRAYCEDALSFWLNENPDKNILYYAVTSYAIETWLLATLKIGSDALSDLVDPYDLEDLPDWEDRLIRAGFSKVKKNGRDRLRKSPSELYEKYGEQIAANLVNVRKKCLSAENLCVFLEKE